jgi:hypothetical protein
MAESIHSSTPNFELSSESDGEDGLFCGKKALSAADEPVEPSLIRRMADSIHSRTPDFDLLSESDGEDGLFYEKEALSSAHEPVEDDGFYNDDDQVVVASDAYSWKIDHSKGDHKLKGEYC